MQDLISYISISTKYFNGNYNDAINGVWGPLISWLMVPFNFINLNLIISFKILQTLIGAFTLIGAIKLYETFGFQKTINSCLIFSTILIIDQNVFLTGTPDLLLASILIYLILVFLKVRQDSFRFSIFSGILGALMYFSKPYGLPAFIAIYIGINFYLWLNRKVKNNVYSLKFGILGLVIFFFIITPWVYALSIKYGSMTFSSGGEYNFAIVGPKYNGVHVPRIEKLYKPVNETAVSYWEDPTFLKVETWNPIANWRNISHLLKIIIKNTLSTLEQFLIFSPFFFLLLFTISPKKIFIDKEIAVISFVLLIYVSGLLFLFTEMRFLIITRIILLLITGRYYYSLSDKFNFSKRTHNILSLLLFISLAAQPVYSFLGRYNTDRDIFILSEKLDDIVLSGYNAASVSSHPLGDEWGPSLTLSYLTGLKYYGEVNHRLDEESLYSELKKYDIKYLFVWDNVLKISNSNFLPVYKDKVLLKRGFQRGEKSAMLALYLVKKSN